MKTCRKCKKEIPDESIYCLYCGVKQTLAHSHSVKKRGNGQGTVYKTPSGKYRAEVVLGYYTDEKGVLRSQRKTKTFDKKSDALLAIPELLQSKVTVKPKSMTLMQLKELYELSKDYQSLGKGQQQKLGYAWDRLSPLHYRKISDLTVDDLQTTIDAAVSTYYPARDMKVMLSHLYNLAIRKELVALNKTEYIDLPPNGSAKRQRWTDDELQLLWDDYAAGCAFTGYILIMTYAGLRYGELAALQLENIDINRQVMIGGIKTEAGIDREIPIADRILPIVSYFYERGKYKLLEMNEDNFYRQYWSVVDRLGLRHLPPHTCRHTYFSLMTAAGIQAGIITETGGHTSYLTTMKHYVSLSLTEKLAAVNKI